jgi:hypothetical protein
MAFEVQRLKEKRRKMKSKVEKWEVWEKFSVADPLNCYVPFYFIHFYLDELV